MRGHFQIHLLALKITLFWNNSAAVWSQPFVGNFLIEPSFAEKCWFESLAWNIWSWRPFPELGWEFTGCSSAGFGHGAPVPHGMGQRLGVPCGHSAGPAASTSSVLADTLKRRLISSTARDVRQLVLVCLGQNPRFKLPKCFFLYNSGLCIYSVMVEATENSITRQASHLAKGSPVVALVPGCGWTRLRCPGHCPVPPFAETVWVCERVAVDEMVISRRNLGIIYFTGSKLF